MLHRAHVRQAFVCQRLAVAATYRSEAGVGVPYLAQLLQ